MDKISTVKFKGVSDIEYSFDVYPLETTWSDNVAAIYVVTRRDMKASKKFSHKTIYVGQTDNLKERHAHHHREKCFSSNDANCLCIHLETSEKKRMSIERDLIECRNLPCNHQSISSNKS